LILLPGFTQEAALIAVESTMDGNAKQLFNARSNSQAFSSISEVLEWIGKTFNLAENMKIKMNLKQNHMKKIKKI
jgi:hypothetical protein